MRAGAYYLLALAALPLFACEVCEYMGGAGLAATATVFGITLGAAFLLRLFLVPRLVLTAPEELQPRRQFLLETGLLVLAAGAAHGYQAARDGFPVESGLKLLLGFVTIGVFCGFDAALDREYQNALRAKLAMHAPSEVRYFFSLTRKLAFVAISILVLVGLDLAVLVIRDVEKLVHVESMREALGSEVVTETAIVLAVLLLLTVSLVMSFSRNLSLFLSLQRGVLEKIAEGELGELVPVASSDELGLIAAYTNRMIEQLRERQRIKEVFGKLVSPHVARKLLASNDGAPELGGARCRVAVLFSDVRDFTSMTEREDPERVVTRLNRHFSEMVRIVHEEGGIVDKFIGDGIMAIFGLDQPDGAVEHAVAAAVRMQAAASSHGDEGGEGYEIGIGVHVGEVIAGNVGSPERLEFTCIGDAVNTAARLEGLSKVLGARIVVSDEVFHALSQAKASWPWRRWADQSVKGRSATLDVYGLEAAPAA
jgi:adenylate cyclase